MTVLLAKTYDLSIDPTGMWVSEKINGVRAHWDGKQLLTRNGNVIRAPHWFTKSLLPTIPVDGELFLSRANNGLERVVSIMSDPNDNGWKDLSYIVFDIPMPEAGPVEERWNALQKLVKFIDEPHIQFLPQTLCTGREQLEKLLDLVIAQGGEGCMLRKAKSRYENKRSGTLLKCKRYHDDEAIVIGYQESEINTEGKAHLLGSMGALFCKSDRFPAEFKVGTGFSDAVRLNPPKIGSKITYKYLHTTAKGVPYAPVFVGERNYE